MTSATLSSAEFDSSAALGPTPVWDEELAMIAKRWAEQCTVAHDSNRDTHRFNVGQNVAATWTFNREPRMGRSPQWMRHIDAWFMEVMNVGFNPGHIDRFQFNKPAGHYTQV
ncbi:unnamed protein product [Darwinula stevensoni]|uniref:SCP domain-containing protein n=1 Tax=Darwinula stevensoni TaxID=69355 RepID=A0A7R9AJY3_9CRUS|nr:unnamed protein product [Darwinula stevensoni]CAG0909473.1 unnamed protein product [Darwinula stevensoni]